MRDWGSRRRIQSLSLYHKELAVPRGSGGAARRAPPARQSRTAPGAPRPGEPPSLRAPSGPATDPPTGPGPPPRVPSARARSALIGCRPAGRGRAPLRGRCGAGRDARWCCRSCPMHCTRYGRAAATPRRCSVPPLLIPLCLPRLLGFSASSCVRERLWRSPLRRCCSWDSTASCGFAPASPG